MVVLTSSVSINCRPYLLSCEVNKLISLLLPWGSSVHDSPLFLLISPYKSVLFINANLSERYSPIYEVIPYGTVLEVAVSTVGPPTLVIGTFPHAGADPPLKLILVLLFQELMVHTRI